MKFLYAEISPLEALKLLADNGGEPLLGFAVKDRSEGCNWTPFPITGVNLYSDYPFASRLTLFQRCARIEKLDPVASGYNPKGLKESEVEVSEGWRLLTEEEVVANGGRLISDTQWYNPARSTGPWSLVGRWYVGGEAAGRTKKPVGFYLPKPDVFVPWTLETAPKGLVLIRAKELRAHVYVVTSWCTDYIFFGAGASTHRYRYVTLLSEHEHSLDGGKTWSPCG